MTIAINSIKRGRGPDPEIPRSHGRRNDQSVAVALDCGALRSYQRPGRTVFAAENRKGRERGGIGWMQAEREVKYLVDPQGPGESHVRKVDSDHLRARFEWR